MPDDERRHARDEDEDERYHEGRPQLSRRDLWRLIRASYATSLPYFLVFLAGLALATWIVTTLVF